MIFFRIDWFDLPEAQGTLRVFSSTTIQNISSTKEHPGLIFLRMNWLDLLAVHSEGDQPWDFFGKNDAKAETPVLWPPHAKS